jgi:hypothetical protein
VQWGSSGRKRTVALLTENSWEDVVCEGWNMCGVLIKPQQWRPMRAIIPAGKLMRGTKNRPWIFFAINPAIAQRGGRLIGSGGLDVGAGRRGAWLPRHRTDHRTDQAP